MSKRAMVELLEDKNIDLWWADDFRGNGRGWARVSDVGCSRIEGAVSVPRRRISAYHWAEVIHEVAHLEMWRWTGRSPARHDEEKVCELAIAIATQYGFGGDTLDHLKSELAATPADELARRVSTAHQRDGLSSVRPPRVPEASASPTDVQQSMHQPSLPIHHQRPATSTQCASRCSRSVPAPESKATLLAFASPLKAKR